MAGLSVPPHVLAALAGHNGPPGGLPPDPSGGLAPGGPPGLPPPGGMPMPPPGPGGLDPLAGAGGMGAPDPSTPEGAMAFLTPLVMAQQAQAQQIMGSIQQQQAQAMAQAMAAAMQNTQNPAGAAAATLPGDPTAPGSGLGGPPPMNPSAPPQGTY